jgi:hypothetical protein
MTEPVPALIPSPFDQTAFGVPYFRVTDPISVLLSEEIAAIRIPPVIIDAKAPSSDLAAAFRLMRLDFLKVCMQVTLACPVADQATCAAAGVEILPACSMDRGTLDAHGRNFRFDRFALDPRIPHQGRVRLYSSWLANSLSGQNGKMTARLGDNVCTFACRENELVIDLMSVLEPRKGIGQRLLASILAYAFEKRIARVRVTTECENLPAWNLYQKCGFLPISYTSVYHLVEGVQPD